MTLESLVTAFIDIIIDYYKLKTGKEMSSTLWESIKNPKSRYRTLSTFITEATATTNTRAPLLNYFLFIVETIQPILDEKRQLSLLEESMISEILIPVISTCQTLMSTANTVSLHIPYHPAVLKNMKALAPSVSSESQTQPDEGEAKTDPSEKNEPQLDKHFGFIGGWPFGCTGNIAAIINVRILDPLNLNKPAAKIEEEVSKLILEHQNPLIISGLKRSLTAVIKEKTTVVEQLKTCQEQLLKSQEQIKALQLKLAAYESAFEKKSQTPATPTTESIPSTTRTLSNAALMGTVGGLNGKSSLFQPRKRVPHSKKESPLEALPVAACDNTVQTHFISQTSLVE